MKHKLSISFSKKPDGDAVVSCRNVPVREKLLQFLMGGKTTVTVIVPGDSVEELEIKEIGKEESYEAV